MLPAEIVVAVFDPLHRGRIEAVSTLIALAAPDGDERARTALRALLRTLLAWRALRVVA